jgi:hypothetical protein
MKLSKLTAAALAFGTALLSSAADATVFVDFSQVGPDVVAVASGTANIASLTDQGSFSNIDTLRPVVGFVGMGDLGDVEGYSGLTGPASFGPGETTNSSSSSGTSFDLSGSSFGTPYLFVPAGFVSGSSISSTSTWLGSTFASLGLTPGTYIYQSQIDVVAIVRIGSAEVPEPSTWAMMLVGFGAIGLAMRRRRRSACAIA